MFGILQGNKKTSWMLVNNILKCRKISQFVMLIAGISMICYGAIRGEADAVLSKAIKLCLECVGIG